jgi:hypothetical protein
LGNREYFGTPLVEEFVTLTQKPKETPMPTEAIQMIADEQDRPKETAAQSHFDVYGWIYVVFVILTALAAYVVFTSPQG